MLGKEIYSSAKKGQTLMVVRENVRLAKTSKASGDVTWNDVEEVRLVDERRYRCDRDVFKLWQPKPLDAWETTTANSYGYLIQSLADPTNYRVIRSNDFIGTKAQLKEALDEKQRVKEKWEQELKERQRIQNAIREEAQERVDTFVQSARQAITDILGEQSSLRTTMSVSYNLGHDPNMQPKLQGTIGIAVDDWSALLHILMQAKAKSDA